MYFKTFLFFMLLFFIPPVAEIYGEGPIVKSSWKSKLRKVVDLRIQGEFLEASKLAEELMMQDDKNHHARKFAIALALDRWDVKNAEKLRKGLRAMGSSESKDYLRLNVLKGYPEPPEKQIYTIRRRSKDSWMQAHNTTPKWQSPGLLIHGRYPYNFIRGQYADKPSQAALILRKLVDESYDDSVKFAQALALAQKMIYKDPMQAEASMVKIRSLQQWSYYDLQQQARWVERTRDLLRRDVPGEWLRSWATLTVADSLFNIVRYKGRLPRGIRSEPARALAWYEEARTLFIRRGVKMPKASMNNYTWLCKALLDKPRDDELVKNTYAQRNLKTKGDKVLKLRTAQYLLANEIQRKPIKGKEREHYFLLRDKSLGFIDVFGSYAFIRLIDTMISIDKKREFVKAFDFLPIDYRERILDDCAVAWERLDTRRQFEKIWPPEKRLNDFTNRKHAYMAIQQYIADILRTRERYDPDANKRALRLIASVAKPYIKDTSPKELIQFLFNQDKSININDSQLLYKGLKQQLDPIQKEMVESWLQNMSAATGPSSLTKKDVVEGVRLGKVATLAKRLEMHKACYPVTQFKRLIGFNGSAFEYLAVGKHPVKGLVIIDAGEEYRSFSGFFKTYWKFKKGRTSKKKSLAAELDSFLDSISNGETLSEFKFDKENKSDLESRNLITGAIRRSIAVMYRSPLTNHTKRLDGLKRQNENSINDAMIEVEIRLIARVLEAIKVRSKASLIVEEPAKRYKLKKRALSLHPAFYTKEMADTEHEIAEANEALKMYEKRTKRERVVVDVNPLENMESEISACMEKNPLKYHRSRIEESIKYMEQVQRLFEKAQKSIQSKKFIQINKAISKRKREIDVKLNLFKGMYIKALQAHQKRQEAKAALAELKAAQAEDVARAKARVQAKFNSLLNHVDNIYKSPNSSLYSGDVRGADYSNTTWGVDVKSMSQSEFGEMIRRRLDRY